MNRTAAASMIFHESLDLGECETGIRKISTLPVKRAHRNCPRDRPAQTTQGLCAALGTLFAAATWMVRSTKFD
jgi:hypothetical protein